MPRKPAIGQTGLILGIGAVGLGLVLLPGFFQRREDEREDERGRADTGPAGPAVLEPTPLSPFVPTPAPTPTKKEDKSKPTLRASRSGNQPTLSVTAGRGGTGYDYYGSELRGVANRNRGVGSHMQAGAVDVWNAREILVNVDWDITNPTNERTPFDFRLRLRQTKDFSAQRFLFSRGWGNAFARDETSFEYTPGTGVKADKFFDVFKVGAKTSHGASKGRAAHRRSIAAGRTERVKMGLVLPGPAQSKELREFWESGPSFNFIVEVYQGSMRFAEHEFKTAFSTMVERPVLRALAQTRGADSPRLTIRGR